jgi:hypothetical protein
MNYLIDAYTIYAASVLAANSIIRSCFGAGFPLFTTYMYHNLGIHWASCVPAFLALACCPFPFIFYRYGPAIRRKCKYAAEADNFMRTLAKKAGVKDEVRDEKRDEIVAEAVVDATQAPEEAGEAASISSTSSLERTGTYEASPYDIDRVNTRNSAITQRSQSNKGWKLFGRK